jgi:hypothetical protein
LVGRLDILDVVINEIGTTYEVEPSFSSQQRPVFLPSALAKRLDAVARFLENSRLAFLERRTVGFGDIPTSRP